MARAPRCLQEPGSNSYIPSAYGGLLLHVLGRGDGDRELRRVDPERIEDREEIQIRVGEMEGEEE